MRMSAARFYLGCLEAGYRKILLLAFFKKSRGEEKQVLCVPFKCFKIMKKYPQPLLARKVSYFCVLLKTKIIVLTFSH